ncbi:MAG TPA: glucose-6-phosphate dehydrogenase assembly protein OpcA [Candidatus Eremiobacteraceae bacterium]|nr:glucose-6-phosphate dehydrogenase assembly protein OpcA [Candidatus Eremiobacteraceae bacterium]
MAAAMTAAADGSQRQMADVLTQVAVGQIESELHRRRLEMLPKEPHPHTHSCVMTLVIAVEDERDNLDVFNTVESLAGKYPIRVVAVQTTGQRAGDDLAAWVNAECEGKPSAPICSEEVAIQGGVDSVDRIVSVVRGLLRADLPVMLWWRGGTPHGDGLWNGLRPLCDRIIVDSILFGDGAAALDTLRRLVNIAGKQTSVRDLNWERTAPWRAAIASCFDDHNVLALLPHIDRCAITYAAGNEKEQPSARAMLMAGWLVSRLPRLRGHSRTAAGKRWADVASGRVVAIALTSSSCKASVMLVRQPSPNGIEAEAHGESGKQFRRWRFPAHTLTEAELLDGSLEALGSDAIFEAALDI